MRRLIVALLLLLLAGFTISVVGLNSGAPQANASAELSATEISTPLPAFTGTPPQSSTSTPPRNQFTNTPTDTLAATNTVTPTATNTVTATSTPLPAATPQPSPSSTPQPSPTSTPNQICACGPGYPVNLAPPTSTPNQICACGLILAPTASPTATSTATPLPTETPTTTLTDTPTATSTATPTSTPPPTATPRPLHWRMLRSQLVRAKPDGRSRKGPLVRFPEIVHPKGHPVHGWQYIVASRHVRGWVLRRNLYRAP